MDNEVIKCSQSNNASAVISIPLGTMLTGEVESIQLGINSHHITITGYSGSGKSTLLHSIICGILKAYSAEDVQLILHDSGLSEFRLFEGESIPNLRMISTSGELNNFAILLNELDQEIERREKLLMATGAASCRQYVQQHNKKPFSHLIIIMDCSYQFLKWVNANANSFQTMLQKGYALNIFFIIAGHDNALHEYLPESVQRHFNMRILTHQGYDSAYLQLGDREYAEKAQHLICGEAIVNKPTPHIIRIPYLDIESEKQVISQASVK